MSVMAAPCDTAAHTSSSLDGLPPVFDKMVRTGAFRKLLTSIPISVAIAGSTTRYRCAVRLR